MPIIEPIVLIKSPYKAVAEEIYEAELYRGFLCVRSLSIA